MNPAPFTRSVSVTSAHLTAGKQFQTVIAPAMEPEKRDQFASLAHEIRSPLSTINLAVEMLKSVITDDEQRSLLDMIMRGSVRINDMLTDIHMVFRANEIKSEKFAIHQLLDETLAMASDKILLNHITIRKNYAAGDFKIVLNKPQIQIALTNIINNAIDAMAGIKGELTLTTTTTGRSCIIQIEDNGCGISPETLNKIFEPYYTNKPDGLGLGLATTQEILRSNNVTLNVRSTVAKGTNFILSFGENDGKDLFVRVKNVLQPSGNYHPLSCQPITDNRRAGRKLELRLVGTANGL